MALSAFNENNYLQALLSRLQSSGSGEMKISVISDPHYFAPSLGTTGDAFEAYLAADRKMIAESDAILQSALDIVKSENPDILLIPGDLTKDGEKISHQAFADYLSELESTGVKVYVIPGNHDVNNPDAMSYEGVTATPVESVSPEEFQEIYHDFGYGEAIYRDPNSLTYIAAPSENLWILGIDSCEYDDNANSPETSGSLGSETKVWILEKLAEAKLKGITVIGMMHHNLAEHYTLQADLFPEYVITDDTSDGSSLAQELAEAGLGMIFTGHYHANDINKVTESGFYEVETGSLVTWPSPVRTLAVNGDGTVEVTSTSVTDIDFDLGGAASFEAYATDFLNTGLEQLAVYYLVSTFGVTQEAAAQVAPLFAAAMAAHYTGDEQPDAVTLGTIQAMALSGDAMQVMLAGALQSLWTDSPTADNNATLSFPDFWADKTVEDLKQALSDYGMTSEEHCRTYGADLGFSSNGFYTLQLLHFSDGEAGLLASETAPYLASMVDAFEDDYENSITLAGGDNYIPGPFLAAGTDSSVIDELNMITGSTLATTATVPIGAVDIAMHNAIGVEASAIGNHEYDLGSNVFGASFKATGSYAGAQFPFISANLDFSGDADLKNTFIDTTATAGTEAADTLKGKIVPSAVIEENGEMIGLVGATTQILEAISSPSGTEVKGFVEGTEKDDMVLLAAQLQPVIDDLRAQGVNKIILMSHLQVIDNEIELAGLLAGVDIIMSAGSNTRMGDSDDEAVAFPGHADNFKYTYPLVLSDKESNTTLLVNTDNEYTYLGRLVVEFDDNGNIVLDSLTANTAVNGAYAATAENVAKAWNIGVDQIDTVAFAEGTRGGAVKTLTDAVQEVIDVKDGNVYGYSDVYLEGERSAVRSEETNLGDLSADANAYAAKLGLGLNNAENMLIVSLKNGGGIRAQIGTISAPDPVDGTVDKLPPTDGSVSQLDVENSLRFNNQLMMFDTTPEGLKAILEHGVAAGTLQGRFPQIGGLKFSWNPDNPAGSRISDISLVGEDYYINIYNDGEKLETAPESISMVTLSYLANGGDSYPIKANGNNFRYIISDDDGNITLSTAVDETMNFTAAASVPGAATPLGEQKAFEIYMEEFHASEATAFADGDTPVAEDARIQNLDFREENILEPFGSTNGNDTFTGTAEDDIMYGSGGNDRLTGKDGDDILVGGVGNDTMQGDRGNDTYYVDSDGDIVRENASGLFGSLFSGTDTVISTVSRTLDKNIENLVLKGSDGISGTGNLLNNQLTGNDGDNILDGLFGNDTLVGGAGADQLIGGWGRDSFRYTSESESGLTVETMDVILDFRSRQDKLDLSGIDADITLTGDQAFSRVILGGSDLFTEAGQLRFDGASDILYGNIDSDVDAEFAIHLWGISNLLSSDIVL